VLLVAAQIKPILTAMQTVAVTYRARASAAFAFRYATAEPIIPSSQTIKPDANGNATRWQGYVAREGFGITRIKNQIRAARPVNGNSHQMSRCLRFGGINLPVFGQILFFCLPISNGITFPPFFKGVLL